MSETFKCIYQSTTGLAVKEEIIPKQLEMYQVLVKIVACGISVEDYVTIPNDTCIDLEHKSFGTDISGIVQSIGSGVETLHVGDYVAGVVPISYKLSGCAEYVILEEYDLVRVPDGINLMDVAAVIGDCLRTYVALFYSSKISRDDTVLVLKGALPCANICIQILYNIGCKVLTTCISATEKSYLENFSKMIDGIIDLSSCEDVADSLYSECMKKTDGIGVDVILDLETQLKQGACYKVNSDAIISCLTIHGRWVLRDANLQLDPPDSKKLFERCANVCFVYEQAWLISKIAQGKYQHILLDMMNKLKSNTIRPSFYETVSFEAVPEVISRLCKANTSRFVVSMK